MVRSEILGSSGRYLILYNRKDKGMINVLMCVYKSGDVIRLVLEQFVQVDAITRILVADGPHLGNIKPGTKVDNPSVKEVVDGLNCGKIFYEYTADCQTRADKNNRILNHVTKDCQWILNVDSDEVYHEKGLARLVKFLKRNPPMDRYSIRTHNPYPDFFHEIDIVDRKPRLYRYFKDCCCPPGNDRLHQYVLSNQQKHDKTSRFGMTELDEEICRIYHLNGLRVDSMRIRPQEGNKVVWKGGKRLYDATIVDLDKKHVPKSVLALNRNSL